jgi:hypothetical protein
VTIPYPVEALMELATQQNVRLVWYPHDNHPKATYISIGDLHVIALSPGLRQSQRDLRCAFAHELGHHVTGVGGERIGGEARDEYRAMRWARRLLLPDEWMLDHLTQPSWEICEEAGVLQSWAEERLIEMERMLLYA